MAVNNSFPPGAFPEHSLECKQHNDLRCSLVERCDSFVELGVVCKNYEDLRSECSRTSTLSTLSTSVHATTPLPSTTCGHIESDFKCNSTIFIAIIGILVAVLLAVSVGWIVSCVILLRRGQTVHKQQWVALNTHLMFTHTNVLFLLNVVYCYSHTVLMQVLSQQGAIRTTHNRTPTHSSTLKPPLLIQPTVDWTEVINRRRKLLPTITLIPTR